MKGVMYDKKADGDSWKRMRTLFERSFAARD